MKKRSYEEAFERAEYLQKKIQWKELNHMDVKKENREILELFMQMFPHAMGQ